MVFELQVQKFFLGEVEQNLQVVKQCLSILVSCFQEYCLDLECQEVEVYKLGQCFDNLCQQVECRVQSLQSVKVVYEDFYYGCDYVLQFLVSIFSYEFQEIDSFSQMEIKLKNQKNLLDEIISREQEVQKICVNFQQYQ